MAKANRSTERDQIIFDPDRPQTKGAQSLAPYEGPVPSYIQAREEIARRAGLSVKRLCGHAYHDLLSVYAGTRDQITACAFIAYPENIHWPIGNRCPSIAQFIRLAPDGETRGNLHRISDDRFVIQLGEDLPTESEQRPGGIERHYFKSKYSEREIFIGTKDQLINGGFADQRMFPDDSTDMGRLTNGLRDEVDIGGYCFCVLETSRLSEGKFALIRNLDDMARVRELKRKQDEEKREDLASPEEWLERIEDSICRIMRVYLSEKVASIETKSGMRFTANAARLAEIANAIETIAQQIRDVPVKVERLERESTPEARAQTAMASTDKLFQRFMQRAAAPATPMQGRDEQAESAEELDRRRKGRAARSAAMKASWARRRGQAQP